MFTREIGCVISTDNWPLYTIYGESSIVYFPDEFIWDVHINHPCEIMTLAHTHPPYCISISNEDYTTLKAWSYAFSPKHISMDVISENKDTEKGYSHRRHWFTLQTLEQWISAGKKGERTMELHYIDIDEKLFWAVHMLNMSYTHSFISEKGMVLK